MGLKKGQKLGPPSLEHRRKISETKSRKKWKCVYEERKYSESNVRAKSSPVVGRLGHRSKNPNGLGCPATRSQELAAPPLGMERLAIEMPAALDRPGVKGQEA